MVPTGLPAGGMAVQPAMRPRGDGAEACSAKKHGGPGAVLNKGVLALSLRMLLWRNASQQARSSVRVTTCADLQPL